MMSVQNSRERFCHPLLNGSASKRLVKNLTSLQMCKALKNDSAHLWKQSSALIFAVKLFFSNKVSVIFFFYFRNLSYDDDDDVSQHQSMMNKQMCKALKNDSAHQLYRRNCVKKNNNHLHLWNYYSTCCISKRLSVLLGQGIFHFVDGSLKLQFDISIRVLKN